MAQLTDYLIDLVKNSWTETTDGADNTAATVTHAAEAERHHVICKVDASFDASTSSALLTVSQGSTVIANKTIHGGGAIDFGVFGIQSGTANEAVSATLAAGGAGVGGQVTMTGYTTGPDA